MSRENEWFRGGQGRSARSVREDGESLLMFVLLAILSVGILALL